MRSEATGPFRIGRGGPKIAALIAAIFSGCAAPESGAPLVEPLSPIPSEAPPEGEEAAAEIDAIVRASEAGDYEDVIRRADALLQRPLPVSARGRVGALRTEARRRLLQTLYVDAIIRLDREDVALGDPISGEVILVNLSGKPVAVKDAVRGAGGRSMLQLDVAYAEDWPDGTAVRDRLVWSVAIGRDLVIPPGGREVLPLDLDTLARRDGPGHPVRTYDVSASLFPSELTVDGEAIPGTLRFASKRVRVLPRNYEHLKDDPKRRVVEAIEKKSPVHVPLAAALVKPADRDATLEVLLSALEGRNGLSADAATRVACCVAARVMLGGDLGAEPEHWIEKLRAALQR